MALPRVLAAVPVELPAIAIHIAILTAKFAAFMPCGGVIAISKVTTQFAAIVPNLVFVVPNVTACSAIVCERRSHSHSHQQQDASNYAFHIVLRTHSTGLENGTRNQLGKLRAPGSA